MTLSVRSLLAWVGSGRPGVGHCSRRGTLIAGVLFGAAVLGLGWLGSSLPPWVQGLGWGVLLLAAAWLLGGSRFLGPVFFCDFLRTTRHGRHVGMRCLYAILLLFVLFLLYADFLNLRLTDWQSWFQQGQLPPRRMAEFAEAFFGMFMIVQFLTVLLITPVYAGGAIAEEREKKTLEYLLTTDLHDREIIFGKTLSRLSNLALLLLTGLPILSLVQFLGGVEPSFLLAGFAGTSLTMLSLASVSILLSCSARKPADAVFGGYFWAVVYLLFSGILSLWCSFWGGPGGPIDWIVAGNPFVALTKLSDTGSSPTTPLDLLPDLVKEYAIFHGLVALVCLTGSALRLRGWRPLAGSGPVGTTGDPAPVSRSRGPIAPLPPRPAIGEAPLFWKELHVDVAVRWHRMSPLWQGVGIVVAAGGFLALFWGMVLSARDGLLHEFTHLLARGAGTPIACMMIVVVALRAAGSISNERDRQTLDTLLTIPVASRAIVFAKWAGSLLCVRKAWWAIGVLWVLAVVCRGMHPLAVPLCILAWAAFAAFGASLGVWFSLHCRTSLRAIFWTIVVLLVACLGDPLVSLALRLIWGFWGIAWVELDVSTLGASPPATLFWLAFSPHELLPTTWQPVPVFRKTLPFMLGGIAFYGLSAAVLWWRIVATFDLATGRVAFSHPPAVPVRLSRT